MVASRARADARRYAPLAYARTKGAFHVQPAMAVTKSSPKSSAKSKSKAPAAGRKSGPTAQERLVQGLIEFMQQGVAPWRKPWDGSGSGHHCNLISGHRYRGSNPILLTLGMHIRGSALPIWCGYAEAKGLGISPKKGSKAAMILRPQLHQQGDQAEPSQQAEAGSTEGAARSWVSYRPVAVFNAADLEGPGLTELIAARHEAAGLQARPEPERLAAAEAVLFAWPVPVSFGGDRACYLPQLDRIQLPERAGFDSPLLAPMRNVAAIENCNRGIDAMARDEAAYWLGMAMHRKNPLRELAALRLLLSAS